ncbi:hypothetical protein CEV33_0245 [Brucella grignonensis]|uniref:Uncharacterized protein n=1 Tax=Brucella grignonensis TaxID=94627 RepID=A0A256FLK4_9HYPH|nr:hypothetical protein CEV33_0245 [Brucella grignonensis]
MNYRKTISLDYNQIKLLLEHVPKSVKRLWEKIRVKSEV